MQNCNLSDKFVSEAGLKILILSAGMDACHRFTFSDLSHKGINYNVGWALGCKIRKRSEKTLYSCLWYQACRKSPFRLDKNNLFWTGFFAFRERKLPMAQSNWNPNMQTQNSYWNQGSQSREAPVQNVSWNRGTQEMPWDEREKNRGTQWRGNVNSRSRNEGIQEQHIAEHRMIPGTPYLFRG